MHGQQNKKKSAQYVGTACWSVGGVHGSLKNNVTVFVFTVCNPLPFYV